MHLNRKKTTENNAKDKAKLQNHVSVVFYDIPPENGTGLL